VSVEPHARNPLTEDAPPDQDRYLVARGRTGDTRALDELVRRHQGWIYNIAVRMLAHPQDAEDATQEMATDRATALPPGGRTARRPRREALRRP
jgi:hypothetical protein